MALVRPTEKSNYGSGIKKFALVGVKDLFYTGEVDRTNPQICLELTLQAVGSDYESRLRLWGDLKFDASGQIDPEEMKVVKHIYSFFDTIGFQGGINATGAWEAANGDPIVDIAAALAPYIRRGITPPTENEAVVAAFMYKRWNERQKKAYNTIYPKFCNPKSTSEIQKLESFIDFMKKKGNIVEHVEGQEPAQNTTVVTGNDW